MGTPIFDELVAKYGFHPIYHTNDVPICGECQAGAHEKCDGTTWDHSDDETTECPCWKAEHQVEPKEKDDG